MLVFDIYGEIMSYGIIYFDADNTLFDFDKAEYLAFKKTIEAFSIPFTEELYQIYSKNNANLWTLLEKGLVDKKTLVLKRFSDTFDMVNITADVESINATYVKNLGLESVLFPGVNELLSTLKKAGKKMYVLTNGVEDVQKTRFKLSGIQDFFESIFISDVIGYQKPAKEFFDYVIANTKDFNKEDVVMIGDSLHSDMLGSVNVGIDTIWFNFKHKENVLNLPIKYEIDNLSQILDIVL